MTLGPQGGDGQSWGRRSSGAASPDEVLGALSRAMDVPIGLFHVEPHRVAGRATIFLVDTPTPIHGRLRWVVKQAHTDYVQVDVDSPVGAAEEFRALTRLHAHFLRVGGPVRVPEPLALLPEIGALAMEYVPGRGLRDLVRYRSLRSPGLLLKGLAGAAQFIRLVHALEEHTPLPISLDVEAQRVLSAATTTLQPHGLTLPWRVTRILSEVAPMEVDSQQVCLHGDFVPTNIILADDGSTVGIDPALAVVSAPEEDLARFVALMSGGIRFAPGVVGPPVNWLRRRLEGHFLDSYYGSSTYPPLFELKLLEQLAGRWVRLRQLGERTDPGWLLPIRWRAVDAQIRMLMVESSERFARTIAQ